MNLLKGPWKIKGYGGQHDEAGAYIVDANGDHAASSPYLRCNTPEAWKEYQAKAYVIAAAPQMYEALLATRRLNLHLYAKGTIGADLRDQIEDAIKAAEKGPSE
jgi:hypothetical protein